MTPRSLAVFLVILAASLVRLALELRGPFLLALWPAVSAGTLSIAYSLRTPALLGKREDGTHALWAWGVFGPYILFTLAIWRLAKLGSEPAMNEVSPRIWVGRRLSPTELPADIEWVVDLTAELPEPSAMRARKGYRCVPTLDATAPSAAALDRIVGELRDTETPILLHCAQGHGRSAAVAAALLIRRGLAPDVDSAERILREARPGVRLKPTQRHAIVSWLSRTS
ncbi:MAG: dual specificity protein phosphatase family protein [Deltaproteobacteria bacterium]|nr:dual specificity protein phosphatase family protein [Deltaproteobacteria bacterium]